MPCFLKIILYGRFFHRIIIRQILKIYRAKQRNFNLTLSKFKHYCFLSSVILMSIELTCKKLYDCSRDSHLRRSSALHESCCTHGCCLEFSRLSLSSSSPESLVFVVSETVRVRVLFLRGTSATMSSMFLTERAARH